MLGDQATVWPGFASGSSPGYPGFLSAQGAASWSTPDWLSDAGKGPTFVGAAAVQNPAAATFTSQTGNLPSTNPGDLNILILAVNSTIATDPGVPTINGSAIASSGYNLIDSQNDTSATSSMPRLTVVWRICQAGDAAVTWAWTLIGNVCTCGIAYKAGTFDPSNPIGVHSIAEQSPSSSSFATNTINPTLQGALVGVFSNRTGGTWTALSGHNKRTEVYVSSAINTVVFDQQLVEPGSYQRTAVFSSASSVGLQELFTVNALPSAVPYTPTNYLSSVSGSVGLTGGDTAATNKKLEAAGLTLTGIRGTTSMLRTLSAGLNFSASSARRTATTLVGGSVGTTGALGRRTGRTLSSAVGFSGSAQQLIVHLVLLTAGLSSVGVQTRAIRSGLEAAIGLTGGRTSAVSRALPGALLAFTSSSTRRIGKSVVGQLSWLGLLQSSSIRFVLLTAGVGLGTSLSRSIRVGLTAGASLVGSYAKETARLQVATLALTGTRSTAIRLLHTAELVAGGTLTYSNLILLKLVASLGFIDYPTGVGDTYGNGNFGEGSYGGTARDTIQILVRTQRGASLALTGVGKNLAGKLLIGTLPLTGHQAVRTAKQLLAQLIGQASLRRSTLRTPMSANLGTSGGLGASAHRFFAATLTATLGLVGTLGRARRVAATLTASLGFSGIQGRRVARTLGATLSAHGSVAKQTLVTITTQLLSGASFSLIPDLISILTHKRIRLRGAEPATHTGGTTQLGSLSGSETTNRTSGIESVTRLSGMEPPNNLAGSEEGT